MVLGEHCNEFRWDPYGYCVSIVMNLGVINMGTGWSYCNEYRCDPHWCCVGIAMNLGGNDMGTVLALKYEYMLCLECTCFG